LIATKLRKLYKIIILLKSIFIVKDIENLCKICVLIEFYNKRNYYVNKCKTIILALVLINICELLLILRLKYKYFLEIVDNYFCKTQVLIIIKQKQVVDILQ